MKRINKRREGEGGGYFFNLYRIKIGNIDFVGNDWNEGRHYFFFHEKIPIYIFEPFLFFNLLCSLLNLLVKLFYYC